MLSPSMTVSGSDNQEFHQLSGDNQMDGHFLDAKCSNTSQQRATPKQMRYDAGRGALNAAKVLPVTNQKLK
jgi:hypothetical protein